MQLRNNDYDPVKFLCKLSAKNPSLREAVMRATDFVSPPILFDLLRQGDPQCWFCTDVYAEMVKRYEVLASTTCEDEPEEQRDRGLSALLCMWQAMRPANVFSAEEFVKTVRRAIAEERKVELVSLMCPAYTIGRNGIATSLVVSRVEELVQAVAVSLSEWRQLISCWRVYLWDERGLTNPLLATTVHPRVLGKRDVAEQLHRSWQLQSDALQRLSDRLGFPIMTTPFTELNGSIEYAKRILDEAEAREQLVSKSVARLMHHGAEDYRRMGEDIREHRQRFINDSFVFTAAVLKEGEFRPAEEDGTQSAACSGARKSKGPLRVMILIESRSHHVGALRLYDFPANGTGRYVIPVWSLPTRLRSFYWVNEGQEQTLEASTA